MLQLPAAPRPHFKPSNGFLGVFLRIKCFGRFQTPFRGFTLRLRFALCYSRPPPLSPHSTGKVLRVPVETVTPSFVDPTCPAHFRNSMTHRRSSQFDVWCARMTPRAEFRPVPAGHKLSQRGLPNPSDWSMIYRRRRHLKLLSPVADSATVGRRGEGVWRRSSYASLFSFSCRCPPSSLPRDVFLLLSLCCLVAWESTFDPLTSPKPICSRKR